MLNSIAVFQRSISPRSSFQRIPFLQNNNFRSNTEQIAKNPYNISFRARPEYDYLTKNYEVRASNYFRRGQIYGSASEKFIDVKNAIHKVLLQEETPKILLVGLGRAQEPFSFLAVINSLSKGKPLDKVVDLHCVDLQPKISTDDLKTYSYLDSSLEPMYAIESFEKVMTAPAERSYSQYKVKPNIFNYLEKVFNNPEKTKWDTLIQDFSRTAPEKSYNMISINNTLGYIENKDEMIQTVDNLARTLKKNGVLVTEVYDDWYRELFPCLKDFKNLAPGIWQKLI